MLEDILALHKQGKLEEAESRYRELLTFNPDDPETLHLLGLARGQRGDLPEAMRLVARAMELAPDRANYYGSLAGMELHARLYDRAREHFEQAVALNPNFTSAYSALGQIAMIKGERERAEKNFKLALQATPDHPQVLTRYGNLLMARGDVDQALKYFSRSAELNPNDVPTQGSLGHAFLRKGHYAFAEQALNNALLNKPDYHPARLLLAETRMLQRRFREAREALRPLFALPDQLASALAALGDVARAEEKYGEAITHYRSALETRREQPAVMHALAWCLARMRLRREAVGAYRAYLQHAPHDRDARRALVAALAELGLHAEAIAALREGLATAPDDREAKAALAALLEVSGEFAPAEALVDELIASGAATGGAAGAVLIKARAALRRGDGDGAETELARLEPAALIPSQRRLAAAIRGHARDRSDDARGAVAAWQEAHATAPAEQAAPQLTAVPAELHEMVEAARAMPPRGAPRRPAAFFLGPPGSGVERVAALLADSERVLLLSDRFGANPRHDGFTAPDFGRYAGAMGEDEVRLFARHYEKPLDRLGVPADRVLIDWLPHFDARLLPAIHRAWGAVPLIVATREPRDALLHWLAFRGAHAYRLESLDDAAAWLARAHEHLAFAIERSELPVLALDAAQVERDPQGMADRLAQFLALPPWQPGIACARARVTLGGLPASLPEGRHAAYASELAGAFVQLLQLPSSISG